MKYKTITIGTAVLHIQVGMDGCAHCTGNLKRIEKNDLSPNEVIIIRQDLNHAGNRIGWHLGIVFDSQINPVTE